MIVSIILLILIILLVSLLIMFTFYIFIPSINSEKVSNEDPLISNNNKTYIVPHEITFEKNDNKALVLCSCEKEFKLSHSVFNKSYTCIMAKSIYNSGVDCKYACIGLGDCLKVCPQNAISIINNTAVISNNCCGCGKCVEICPQKLIKLVPKNTKTYVKCTNINKEMTSCTKNNIEEKVSWDDKKDFKIWKICYNIIRRFTK